MSMEEERGENGCTHRHVWVESEEGTMQFMKRLVFGFLVFMICAEIAVSARDKLIPSLTSPDHAYAHHEEEKAKHKPFHKLHGSLLELYPHVAM